MRKNNSPNPNPNPNSNPVGPAATPAPIGDAADAGTDAASLLEALPWGVVVLDARGTVRRLNQQAAHWWGLAPPDLLGQPLGLAPAGSLPADLLQALRQVTSGPAAPAGEFFLPRHQQWITMSSARQAANWVVYWQDITVQKAQERQSQAQQAASDSLRRRTEAVARTGSYELELATGNFEFSEGLFELFGEAPGAFTPSLSLINDRSYPADVAAVAQVLARAVEDRQPYYYQRRIYRPDGQLRTLEAHGRVECDAQGQPVQLLGLLQDVTAREQAAQQQLQAQAKDELARRATDNYAALYRSMDEGFCIVEVLFDAAQQPADYRFLDVNPAFEGQTGLRGALGKTMRELVPTHEQYWFDRYGRVARTGEPTRFEAQGESLGRWFDVNAFPIGPPQRHHVAILFTDISARKRTEQALRESDARLRQAVGLAHLGICDWDYPTGLMRGNDERLLLLGLDPAPDTLSLAQAVALTHPGDRDVWASIRQQVETQGDFRANYRTVRPGDGAVRWLSEVGRVVEWQQEKPARVSSVLLDVTADHEAAEALRQSEARYRALFTNMEQGFCLVEKVATAPGEPSDYRFLAVNPAFGRHTRLAGAAGHTIRELVPGAESHIMAIFDEVVASGESRRFEEYVTAFDIWLEAEVVPDEQPGHLAVLLSNVSVRRRAEQTLRESAARQAYLLALGDALQPVADAAAVQATVTRIARHHFAADRCYYAEVAGDTATICRDAAQPGLPAVAGVYLLSELPLLRTVLREGGPAVEADVEASTAVDDHLKQLCRDSQIQAYLLVPVFRNAELVGIFNLTQATPRAWTALEVALAQETAERTWVAVQQARAEDALRRSEEEFRLLVTATSDTVYRMSADWTQMDQLLGKNFLADTLRPTPTWTEDYIPAEDLPLVQATIAEAIRHQRPLELEHRVRRADGTVGWTYSRAVPVLGAGGALTGWLGTASDVSARKQAEEQLRASEQRQRVLIENLPGAAVFVVDRDLRYQLAEGEALRQTGFEPADFLGRSVRDVTPPAQWPAFQALYEAALAGHPFAQEHAQSGRVFLTRAVPLPGPAGPVDAVLAVSYDITERKAAEEALQVSEAKYRTLFETMDQGFGIGEVLPAGPGRAADFRWLDVNPQVERLTSMPQAALLSGETMRTVMPQLEDAWYERYERVALTGESVRFEQHMQVLGRWFDVYAYPLDPDGPAPHRVGLLFTNITARKQAEEALRHAEERHREQLELRVAARTQELRESRHLLQTVFDASPTAIVVMRILRDAAGRAEDFEILIFNEFNKQVTGRADLAGQRFTAMFPQTVPTGVLARLLQVATTGEPADFEQWYVGEGIEHWFRHIAVRQGGLLVLTSEVVTARKLLEQAQARSLALLQQSEAVADMGSWEYDRSANELTWSDGLYHLFGQPVGSAVGPQQFLDAVLDDDRPAAARLLRALAAGTSSFDASLRLRLGDAVKTVRFKAVPLPAAPAAPARMLGVCLDVSDVARLEAENLALKLDRHKELLLAILQAQENERQRLAEVLHNSLGQVLYATKLHLDQLDTPALHALPALASLHQHTGRLLAEAMRQTRTLAHELVPTSLADFGLAVAVRDVCRDLSTPQLRVECQVWGEQHALPQPVQVTLFRLAQELAHNIVRHAGATQALLELETLPNWVSLRAEDNGRGFDAQTVAEGLGLRTVRDAVALLGGTVAIDSSPDFGTHIRLRIPLPLFS